VENDAAYRAAERRIERLMLAIGVLVALYSAWRWSWAHAVGILVGTALAWINYRWLKQGLDALARLSIAQEGTEKVRIPKQVYAKFIGRYALIILVVCAIFVGSLLPAIAVLGGLFTLVAAAMLGILYELMRGVARPGAE
jgi:hypothetical protein